MTEFGERVRGRLKALGYWKDDRPDVGRFSLDRGYIPSYIYRWVAGQVPRGASLLRLAADLGVSVEWLLAVPPRRLTKPAPPSDGATRTAAPTGTGRRGSERELCHLRLAARRWLYRLGYPSPTWRPVAVRT
jgi:hypothetical protein